MKKLFRSNEHRLCGGMLFSCVHELVVCFHLAQHGYINQAYTHIRTVFESLNRVELFVRDESYASLWCSDDERTKKRELSPVAVRSKLGVKGDPLYAFFSAHGPHVTWEYVQSKSARKREASEKENPEIVFFLVAQELSCIYFGRMWAALWRFLLRYFM